ncbi:MAG: YifB family Mg chelatase-like AAA ATPase [Calditerrivibrio sp.]|nr:YifB family Mg chelatase-like AAA ATPase [Calditerrivibrio sp.]MCA1933636.1 YifB family Mg chelatase-like AAA ATPase [Calditerrivibrio sp.]MCA1980725.1 YifB family Mg chelatase-like AAA ATPase [Calditerrivibrio sp.]
MFSRVLTFHLNGIDAVVVDVEVDIREIGLPSFTIVGLAEGAVKESKERVKSALKNLNFNFFAKPITINLAPADIKKEGSHFDLPLAVGLIAASGMITRDLSDIAFLGELSLDGELRGVNGVLPMAITAMKSGIKNLFLPLDNAEEASIVKGVDVYGFKNLSEVISFLLGNMKMEKYNYKNEEIDDLLPTYDVDFSDIKGQFNAKRGAEIASAGMHNLLMIGSPGSGKTMIARRIPTILPKMSLEESIETTKIHSVAGILKDKGRLVRERYFSAIHHTTSDIALIGGTRDARPGAISIATNGVLFLDEFLEFKRSVLEVLRQPMEDGVITVSRANKTVTYPAKFMLVAACNPCPCGFYGDPVKQCVCSEIQIKRYRSRLSGPLMDRIDIHVGVTSLNFNELSEVPKGETSEIIRNRVEKAHKIQSERFKKDKIYFNSQMQEKHIKKYCVLDKESVTLLEKVNTKYNFSARSYSKILKVARTIADLESSENILSKHILEAIKFRINDQWANEL